MKRGRDKWIAETKTRLACALLDLPDVFDLEAGADRLAVLVSTRAEVAFAELGQRHAVHLLVFARRARGLDDFGGRHLAVSAVAVIVTAVSDPGTVAGYVTAYAHGATIPPTSNLNQNGDGDVRPNLVVVPVGADGSIDLKLFNTSHVVVDVAGYFSITTSSSGLYHVIAPTRIVDSRVPLGFGALGLGATQSIVPGAGITNTARAVSENVTMTRTLGGGFVTAFPNDEARPTASNGNATAPGQDRASLALTKVGAAGAGAVSYYSSGGTDLVVDITGFFDG